MRRHNSATASIVSGRRLANRSGIPGYGGFYLMGTYCLCTTSFGLSRLSYWFAAPMAHPESLALTEVRERFSSDRVGKLRLPVQSGCEEQDGVVTWRDLV
jgi:hypothetical protein